MTAHRSQSTPTPAAAAIRQWTGTPAEWDAERDRRVEEMRARVPFVSRHVTDSDVCDFATATMPPRPVEPPSVRVLGWTITWEASEFVARQPDYVTCHYQDEALIAFDIRLSREQLDAIRALRDGPAPRYEVCGWGVTRDGKTFTYGSYNSCESDLRAYADARVKEHGGTAHAIYRRVEGDK